MTVIAGSFVTLAIELASVPRRRQASSSRTSLLITLLHIVNLVTVFCSVISLTYYKIDSAFYGTIPCVIATASLLKVISYVLVNRELRAAYVRKGAGEKIKTSDYPRNLTVENLVHFIGVPTLCYQTEYPRSDRIRWQFVARQLVEMSILSAVVYVIFVQYMQPILLNAVKPVLI